MNFQSQWFLAFLLLLPFTLLACGSSEAEPASKSVQSSKAAVDGDTPLVVVELFTSQGCSSCPAADRLLSSFGPEEKLLALAYHVDYWNYLGWRDPFSKALWSARQEAYARVLPAGRLYTPQAVIQGQKHCVGSREACIDDAVQVARKAPQNSTLSGSVLRKEQTLEIQLEAQSTSSRPLEVLAVVFENHLETAVGSGENARRTLRNDRVVRVLRKVFRLDQGKGSGTAIIDLEKGWNLDEVGVGALLQDSEKLTVHNAWASRIPHQEAAGPGVAGLP